MKGDYPQGETTVEVLKWNSGKEPGKGERRYYVFGHGDSSYGGGGPSERVRISRTWSSFAETEVRGCRETLIKRSSRTKRDGT